MRSRSLAAVVALLLGAPGAGAEELVLGIAASAEYDSNIFNASDDEEDDVILRAGPLLELRRRRGDLTYQVNYEPRFENFVDQDGLNAWDHNAFGWINWRIGPRTNLRVSDRFILTRSLNRSFFAFDPDPLDPTDLPITDVEVTRQRTKTNTASLALSHSFTPRVSSTLDVGYTIFESDQENSFDGETLRGTLSGLYTLDSRNQVGGGFGVTRQSFDDTSTQAGGSSIFYRSFATWVHSFSPTFTLTVQAGPTYIDGDASGGAVRLALVDPFPFRNTSGGNLRLIDASTCPTVDDGSPYLSDDCGLLPTEITGADADAVRNAPEVLVRLVDTGEDIGEDDITLFANIRLIKRWERWRLIGRYTRSDSQSSGVSQSSIVDALSVQVTWDPSPLWSAEWGASFTNRESATEQTISVVGLASGFVFLPPSATVVPGAASANLRLLEVDDALEVKTYSTTLRVTRRLARRLEVFGRFNYLKQDLDTQTTSREFDVFRVLLGLRWRFEPIHI